MGTWTLARWQRLMAALGVFAGTGLNVAVIVFHVSISGEGTTAIVSFIGAAGVVLGFILFAGDSTSNAQVAAMTELHYHQLAKHEALAYAEGHESGVRSMTPPPRMAGSIRINDNLTPLVKAARDYSGEV